MEIKEHERVAVSQDVVVVCSSSSNINNKDKDDDDDFAGELENRMSSRYYACSFCNRGFSNAQALGGHMNVHRKDRATSWLLQQQQQDQSIQQAAAAGTTSLIATDDDQLAAHDDHQSSDDDDEQKAAGKRPTAWKDQIISGRSSRIKKDQVVTSSAGGVNNISIEKPTLELSLCIQPSSSASTTNNINIIPANSLPSSTSPTQVLDLELRLGMDGF